ncbi:MAG: hypothetical protein IT305_21200 [Chloroflexi bacterium]|nr:hypothetical protein [Chloroflexota bacterium]
METKEGIGIPIGPRTALLGGLAVLVGTVVGAWLGGIGRRRNKATRVTGKIARVTGRVAPSNARRVEAGLALAPLLVRLAVNPLIRELIFRLVMRRVGLK